MSPGEIDNLRRLLSELLKAIPAPPIALDSEVPPRATRMLMNEIGLAISRLERLRDSLDPIRWPDFVFDPSNPKFVGELVGKTLIEQPTQPLGALHRFYGSGVYAICYTGKFHPYRPIVGRKTPIYVGKADPPTPDAKPEFRPQNVIFGRESP